MSLARAALAAVLCLACHGTSGARDSAASPAPQREAPFVGTIRSVRGDVIFAQEEGGQHRLAEIFLTPGTEITTRDGAMFIPMASLRVNMRVTAWFTGTAQESRGTLMATARRMLVDY